MFTFMLFSLKRIAVADISENNKAEMAGLDEKKQKKIFLTDKTR